jgi:hypothetical protein
MSARPLQDTALSAAQVELFVLRASIPPSATLGGLVAIAPETVPVTTDRAAEILAGALKPIRCIARATAKEVLAVECIQLSGAQESIFHTDYMKVMEERFMSARGSTGSTGFSETVLLRSADRPDEELSVSELTFQRWYREYQLPPSIAFGVWPATRTLRTERVHPVFELLRIEPVDPESLPPELRSLLR